MNFKKYRSRFLLVFATLTLLFSSVLLTSCQGKKIKNTVFSVDDLAGKTIGVQLGTTGDTLVSDYETDGSGTTVSRYNKGSDAIQALKQGKADAVVIDEQPAHGRRLCIQKHRNGQGHAKAEDTQSADRIQHTKQKSLRLSRCRMRRSMMPFCVLHLPKSARSGSPLPHQTNSRALS